MSKPTELAIVMAAMPERDHQTSNDGWVYADGVTHRLRRIGFTCVTQQVASWLRTMSRVQFPWVDSRPTEAGIKQYRVTQWGASDVQNKLGITLETPWAGRDEL